MSEKDRCLNVVEELELKLRSLQRVSDIQEEEITNLREIKNLQDGEIKALKKANRLQQIELERGIS